MTTAAKPDFSQTVTDNLITMLEEGQASDTEWVMPWHRTREPMSLPDNVKSGKEYQGGNIPSLWLDGHGKGIYQCRVGKPQAVPRQIPRCKAEARASPQWHADPLRQSNWIPKDERTGDPDEDAKKMRTATGTYWIYNRDQFDGIPKEEAIELPDLVDRVEAADTYFDNLSMRMLTGGNSAFYLPSKDIIQMPTQPQFKGHSNSTPTQSWYSTLFHEAGHATGHNTRMNRGYGERVPTARATPMKRSWRNSSRRSPAPSRLGL